MRFSIIMPTYNDAETIIDSIESLVNQTYLNWELLISNDGSTDNTRSLLKEFINKNKLENKIKYFEFENGDQNNAILRVLDKITGDYVYLFHSDDLFYDKFVLEKVKKYVKNNPDIDAIISDAQKINENSKNIGIQKTRDYVYDEKVLPLQLLWLGRNLYIDFAFIKKDIVLTKIKESYLKWNVPFWLDVENYEILNVKKVNFPFFKYRVFEGNYINNEIGKLNVINGELRTAVSLMKRYHIPFYKIQYFIFRSLNKMGIKYYPIYLKKETKNKYNTIKFIINKRYTDKEMDKYLYLKNLLSFFESYDNKINNRTIEINKINEDEFIYYGKDIRKFNNDMLANKISKSTLFIINEMKNGFNEVIVQDEKDKEKVKIILKFLNIDKYVKINIKK